MRAEPVDGATADTGDVSEAWPGHCTGYCALFWALDLDQGGRNGTGDGGGLADRAEQPGTGGQSAPGG